MKKTLIVLAMVAAFGASAQTNVDTSSQSGSTSGAQSGSISGVQSSNSGNTSVSAVGNQAGAQSGSQSSSGAQAGSQSGALGNVLEMNNYAPEVQTVLTDMKQTYSGSVENKVSGGTHDVTEVRYSGTQTVKNVPSIAMSGPASGPCTGVSGGIGIAGPGWGFGANGSSVMADCRLRENVRVIGMAMQSLDGQANPQEKGEATVLFMEALRGLAAYNNQVLAEEIKPKAK